MKPELSRLVVDYAKAKGYYERNAARAALQRAWRLETGEHLWRLRADQLAAKHKRKAT